MSIEITVRHVSMSDNIQDYARIKAEEIISTFSKVEHIHVILDKEKHSDVAEVILQAGHHVRLETKEASDNMLKSIDLVMNRLEAQLRKLQDKAQERRHRG